LIVASLKGQFLDLLSFSAYTEDDVDLLDPHKVQSHLYADETQLYASCRPDDVDILYGHACHTAQLT